MILCCGDCVIPQRCRAAAVVRPAQIVMSVICLAVYVFALGTWFATTTWYEPWYGSIALVFFGPLVAAVRLNPLPATGA